MVRCVPDVAHLAFAYVMMTRRKRWQFDKIPHYSTFVQRQLERWLYIRRRFGSCAAVCREMRVLINGVVEEGC